VITDAIGGVLLAIAGAVFSVLPEAGALDMDTIGPAVSSFGAFNVGLPVVETLAMAGVCLAIIGGIFVTRLAITVWHLVPFKFS
jgi:hypothetical protein